MMASEETKIITGADWVRVAAVPWVALGAVFGVLAVLGVEPTSGGWPPLFVTMGAVLSAWTLLVALVSPNRQSVTPERLSCRVRRRWTVIEASEITSVETPMSAMSNTPNLQVRSDGGMIVVGWGLIARHPEVRDALDTFIRNARSTSVRLASAPLRSGSTESGRSRSRPDPVRWVRRAIIWGAALNAVVGLLGLLVR